MKRFTPRVVATMLPAFVACVAAAQTTAIQDVTPQPPQGSVVLEFSVMPDTIPADVRVAASSGFAELDTAALQYAKFLRAKSSCVGTRTRVKVRFTIGQQAS